LKEVIERSVADVASRS